MRKKKRKRKGLKNSKINGGQLFHFYILCNHKNHTLDREKHFVTEIHQNKHFLLQGCL